MLWPENNAALARLGLEVEAAAL